MAATLPMASTNFQVTGPISVERMNGIAGSDLQSRNFLVLLIMGPTGAGKSTFVEALGLRDTERISSNQLEGYTQTVSTYRMNGAKWGRWTVYLVDSPGFADTKISQMAIVSMLQEWMKNNGGPVFHRVLYLTPITQVRLPGSQRQVLKTFQALTGLDTAKNITIITTMWDSIDGERAMTRAEKTYSQLESDIWKGFIDQGARISKFYNTQDSAASILNEAFNEVTAQYFMLEDNADSALRDTPFADNIYKDLADRIENLHSEIATTQSELAYAQAQCDEQLQGVLLPRLDEAESRLARFKAELLDFGPAPDSTPHIRPIRSLIGPIYPPPAAEQIGPMPSPTASTVTHAATLEEQEGQQPHQSQRGQLSRALSLIMGCGCCGKGVEANHNT